MASNLDRPALLVLALKASVDAVQGNWGLSARMRSEESLSEDARVGHLAGIEDRAIDAERSALSGDGHGELRSGELGVGSVALGRSRPAAGPVG